MTTIYYETVPVAHLTFDGKWTLDYDPGWEARRTPFSGVAHHAAALGP